jgi:hypothetical protein
MLSEWEKTRKRKSVTPSGSQAVRESSTSVLTIAEGCHSDHVPAKNPVSGTSIGWLLLLSFCELFLSLAVNLSKVIEKPA